MTPCASTGPHRDQPQWNRCMKGAYTQGLSQPMVGSSDISSMAPVSLNTRG